MADCYTSTLVDHLNGAEPLIVYMAVGVVSEAGSCCARNTTAGGNVTLDRAGQCCSQGLDACGVCGGDGLTVDFTGLCCNDAIDASGLCCAAPHIVDDFGVCGGNSSTGVIVLDLDMLSNSVAGMLLCQLVMLCNFGTTGSHTNCSSIDSIMPYLGLCQLSGKPV